MNIAVNNNGH